MTALAIGAIAGTLALCVAVILQARQIRRLTEQVARADRNAEIIVRGQLNEVRPGVYGWRP